MTIAQMQETYIHDFQNFEHWFDRYAYIMELAGAMEAMDASQKTDEHLVRGCQSNTWMAQTYKSEKLYFQADSDALIVKGVLGIMVDILSGRTPREIVEADVFILDVIGLDDNVPRSRSNGIRKSVEMMLSLAASYA